MSTKLKAAAILLGIFFGSFSLAGAVSVFITQQGGTGTTTPSGILYGDNGVTSHLNSVRIGSGLTFSAGTLSSSATSASSTLLGDNNTFSGNDIFNNQITGSISGNAGTATLLQNSRNINGVAFNGGSSITIFAASSTLLSNNNTFSGTNIFSSTINGAITGNAGTATALAGTPTKCSAGNYPLGIDAQGNAQNCTAASSGSAFPFTPTTNYNAAANATGTPIWFQAGLQASTTNNFLAGLTVDSATTNSSIVLNGHSTTVGSSLTISDLNTVGNQYTALVNPANASNANANTIPLTATFSTGGGTTGGIVFDSKPSSAPIIFYTGGNSLTANERVRILGSGNVGIGTANPQALLDTQGTASSTNEIVQSLATAAGTFVAADPTGKLIATTTPSGGSSASSTLLSDNNTFSGNDTFSNTITGSVSGNAGTATKLATSRTIAITGDLAYTSPSFDGSGNVTAAGTLATVNGNVGTFTYPSVTVNGKGLITAISNGSAPTSYTGTFPISVSGSAISFGGLSTSTAAVQGNIPYFSGVNTFANVATTSATINNGLTGTLTTLNSQTQTIGVANNGITYAMRQQVSANRILGNATGATANEAEIATSTLFGAATPGYILSFQNGQNTYVASTTYASPLAFANNQVTCTTCLTANQTITLSGVVTGSGSTAITTAFGTQNAGVLGAVANGNTTAPLATSTLYGNGIGGQVLAWNNGVPQWVATTTYSSGLTYANGNVTNTGVTSIVAGTNITLSGATGAVTINSTSGGSSFPYPFPNQDTNFGNTANATSSVTGFTAGILASSTSHFANADFVNATSSSIGTGDYTSLWRSAPDYLDTQNTGTTNPFSEERLLSNLAVIANGAEATRSDVIDCSGTNLFNNINFLDTSYDAYPTAFMAIIADAAAGTCLPNPLVFEVRGPGGNVNQSITEAMLPSGTVGFINNTTGTSTIPSNVKVYVASSTANWPFLVDGANGTTAAPSGTPVFSIASTSFVGIGTNFPAQKLEVDGSLYLNGAGTTLGILSRGATSNFGGFQFDTAGSPQWTFGPRNDSTNNFHFFNENLGSDTMFFNQATNNVGIGTSTPVYPLDISSASNPQIALSAGARFSQWAARNSNGTFYLSTTTIAGTATSTIAAFALNGSTGAPTFSELGGSVGCIQATAAGLLTNTGSACLTANQTITLSGAVTGSGSTAITTSFGTQNAGVLGAVANGIATAPLATSTLYGPTATFLTTGNVGIGTSTPPWKLDIASSSASASKFGQFALTDTNAPANFKHWLFSSLGGNLYIGTTTDAYATSTTAALTILGSGAPSLSIGSSTQSISAVNGLLTLGSNGANGTSTVSSGKIQFDGYNASGARICMYAVGTSLVIQTGSCNP